MENKQFAKQSEDSSEVLAIDYYGESAKEDAEILRAEISKAVPNTPEIKEQESEAGHLDAGQVVLILLATMATKAAAKVVLNQLDALFKDKLAERKLKSRLVVIFTDEKAEPLKSFMSDLGDFGLETTTTFISEMKSFLDKI